MAFKLISYDLTNIVRIVNGDNVAHVADLSSASWHKVKAGLSNLGYT
jgi:hypothetical protein